MQIQKLGLKETSLPIEWKENLLRDTQRHKLNTARDETFFENHLKIDNTNLLPEQVADLVIKEYKLVPNQKEKKEYRFGVQKMILICCRKWQIERFDIIWQLTNRNLAG